MKPVLFKGFNHILKRPSNMTEEECADLPVHVDGRYAISCWRLSWKDLIQVIIHRRVWLWVYSRAHPPVSVEANSPFEERTKFWQLKAGGKK